MKDRNLPTIQKIQLSEKNVKFRFILALILFAVGAFFLWRWFTDYLGSEDGWTTISVNASSDANLGDQMVFQYDLGQGNESATAENKALTILYTDYSNKAYYIFDADIESKDINNLYYLNQHPNKKVTIDKALYKALKQSCECQGGRYIFLGPVNELTSDLFYCTDDSQARDIDPYEDNALVTSDDSDSVNNISKKDLVNKIAQYASNPSNVSIEFYDNNQVELKVSDDYKEFCKYYGLTKYIDFGWMRNAFAVDYISSHLASRGYELGMISSYDGFTRTLVLGENSKNYDAIEGSYNIYNLDEAGSAKIEDTFDYKDCVSIVTMRSFAVSDNDAGNYYLYDDSTCRTKYYSLQDGLCHCNYNNFTAYDKNLTCSQLALTMAPIFIDDETLDTIETSFSYYNY